MATLTLTFDTGNVPLSRISDALTKASGWTATVPDPANPGQTMPNPITQAQAPKEFIKQFIIRNVREQEVLAARQTADAGVTPVTLT